MNKTNENEKVIANAVNHPAHYQCKLQMKQLECIDIVRHLDFCRGNAFKYIWRAGTKGDINQAMQDIEKAKWYIPHIEGKSSPVAEALMNLIIEPQDDRCEYLRFWGLWWIIFNPQNIHHLLNELVLELQQKDKERQEENSCIG